MGETRSTADEPGGAGPLPGGWLAYDRLSAPTGATVAEATVIEVVVTVREERALRVLWGGLVGADAEGTRGRLRIREDGTEVQVRERTCPEPGQSEEVTALVHVTPAAGDHRYAVTLERASGSGAVHVDAGRGFPAELIVEDVGPAPS